MRAHPWLATAFPHLRKIRYSRPGVYRRAYSMSLGQESLRSTHEFESSPMDCRGTDDELRHFIRKCRPINL
jgi:hypothetical protein